MPSSDEPKGLVVLWITQDKEAAMHMALLYAKNARIKGWWEQVRLVIWGPSVKLLTSDAELQAEVEDCKAAGVELQACRVCADRYGLCEALENLGVNVIFMGAPLTSYLKDGWKVLSV